MREFRLLRPDEIECRISEVSKTGKYVRVLLYKTARTDYALLDEKFGIAGWQNKYEVIDGKMYCGIGIKAGDEWIWKWNCGTESNTEAEKGQASDALKRAGFALGIGTELYSAPDITLFPDKCNIKQIDGKFKCYDKFFVKAITYNDNQDISALTLVNDKGDVVFQYGAKSAQAQKKPAKTEPQKPVKTEEAKPDKMKELQKKIEEAFPDDDDGQLPWENNTEESVLNLVRQKLIPVKSADEMNKTVALILTLEHVGQSKEKASKLVRMKANELGLKLDRATKKYVA